LENQISWKIDNLDIAVLIYAFVMAYFFLVITWVVLDESKITLAKILNGNLAMRIRIYIEKGREKIKSSKLFPLVMGQIHKAVSFGESHSQTVFKKAKTILEDVGIIKRKPHGILEYKKKT